MINFSFLRAEIVNEIIIDGNVRVSNETVLIYGEIKKGVDYQEKDINSIIKNLYSTEFFENVSVNLSNNVLRINLKEYKIKIN